MIMSKSNSKKNKSIVEIAKDRNFKIVKVNKEEQCFTFLYLGTNPDKKDILVEVYAGHNFSLCYTNSKMTGVLVADFDENFENNLLFNKILESFTETVCVLRDYYDTEE